MGLHHPGHFRRQVELSDIAQAAAEAVASMMATPGWAAARARLARWLGQGDPERTLAHAADLDEHREAAMRDEQPAVEEHLCGIFRTAIARDRVRRDELLGLISELRATRTRPATVDNNGWRHHGEGPTSTSGTKRWRPGPPSPS
jgi:hypothetical protein